MLNIFYKIILCSVSMSVVAVLYYYFTPYLSKKINPRTIYIIWIAIILGFLIPVRPTFRVKSIPEIFYEIPMIKQFSYKNENVKEFEFEDLEENKSGSEVQQENIFKRINIQHYICYIWIFGVFMYLAEKLQKHYIFMKSVRRWAEDSDNNFINASILDLKNLFGINKKVFVKFFPCISSPMLIGLFKPTILLPKKTFTDSELNFILKHELVHLKNNDLIIKIIGLFANSIHWFNPVIYLVLKSASSYCEIVCDVEVTKEMNPEIKVMYCETILKVIKNQNKMKTMLSTNFNGGKKAMKDRISFIMSKNKRKKGIFAASLALVFSILAGSTLTFARPLSDNSINSVTSNGISFEVLFSDRINDSISLACRMTDLENDRFFTSEEKSIYSDTTSSGIPRYDLNPKYKMNMPFDVSFSAEKKNDVKQNFHVSESVYVQEEKSIRFTLYFEVDDSKQDTINVNIKKIATNLEYSRENFELLNNTEEAMKVLKQRNIIDGNWDLEIPMPVRVEAPIWTGSIKVEKLYNQELLKPSININTDSTITIKSMIKLPETIKILQNDKIVVNFFDGTSKELKAESFEVVETSAKNVYEMNSRTESVIRFLKENGITESTPIGYITINLIPKDMTTNRVFSTDVESIRIFGETFYSKDGQAFNPQF